MDNDKKYYWLKLKKDFFQQHQIKVLKSLPNGRLYALIYLELMAESTSHNGELRYSQLIPYDTITLSAVLDEDKDNVEKAIEVLQNLELLEILDDGTIYMNEVNKMIGSAVNNDNANRVREFREKQKTLSLQNVMQDITKDNESIEYRVKSKENRVKRDIKHKHGTYNHILLTDEQYNSLLNDLGEKKLNEYIQRVDDYVQMKGKTYKDYNLVIRNWFKKDGGSVKEKNNEDDPYNPNI